MSILRGVRPAALAAVSERERIQAHPHRVQAAMNHARALDVERRRKEAEMQAAPAKKAAKKGKGK